MKNLSKRIFECEKCGWTEGRDRNAARNIYWYGQEGRNRAGDSPTRGKIGDQELAPVLVSEPRMLSFNYHESQ